MKDQLIKFETAELAKNKSFNIEGNIVYDLQNNNNIINFKDLYVEEFIEDVSTGYRDKALNYLKEGYKRVDDNTDDGYFLLAPTQTLLQRWLRETHKIHINIDVHIDENDINKGYTFCVYKKGMDKVNHELNLLNLEFDNYPYSSSYEEALEVALQEGLKLI